MRTCSTSPRARACTPFAWRRRAITLRVKRRRHGGVASSLVQHATQLRPISAPFCIMGCMSPSLARRGPAHPDYLAVVTDAIDSVIEALDYYPMDRRESVPVRQLLDIGCDVSMLVPSECTPINKMARERRSIATQFSHSQLHRRNGKSRSA